MPPAAIKLKYGKNQVLHFDPAPPTGACDVSEVWETHRWTYSPSLVTVSSSKLEILHFVWKRDGITDRQMDDPITTVFQLGQNRRALLVCGGISATVMIR